VSQLAQSGTLVSPWRGCRVRRRSSRTRVDLPPTPDLPAIKTRTDPAKSLLLLPCNAGGGMRADYLGFARLRFRVIPAVVA
jgi:hypothetical protein